MIHKNIENQRRLKKASVGHWTRCAPWFDEDLGRYINKMLEKRRKKWMKHRSNIRIRYYKGIIANGGQFKKVDEYWWDLW